jgi:hypothetical protein
VTDVGEKIMKHLPFIIVDFIKSFFTSLISLLNVDEKLYDMAEKISFNPFVTHEY